MWKILLGFAFIAVIATVKGAFGGHDKYNDRMLLSEISALTLYSGKMTNARRSSPVPQLKCVGGTAGCNSFIPQVVQCYNRGGDGYDVQWECKTDMDNAYRFGQVEVTCEGFEHPDDLYILRGSCGLEYTIDLTMEGHMKKNQQQHDYYGNKQYDDSYYNRQNNGYYSKRASSIFSDVILLCIVGIIIFAIYKTCIAVRSSEQTHRPRDGGYRPPPAGFRSDYMPPPGGESCSSSYTGENYGTQYQAPPAAGGFWTGAFTGGLLGYLMGNRNGAYTYTEPYQTYHRPSPGWGSSWFGGRRSTYSSGGGMMGGSTFGGGGGGSMFGGGGSTGTRTASGFGGTKRR